MLITNWTAFPLWLLPSSNPHAHLHLSLIVMGQIQQTLKKPVGVFTLTSIGEEQCMMELPGARRLWTVCCQKQNLPSRSRTLDAGLRLYVAEMCALCTPKVSHWTEKGKEPLFSGKAYALQVKFPGSIPSIIRSGLQRSLSKILGSHSCVDNTTG